LPFIVDFGKTEPSFLSSYETSLFEIFEMCSGLMFVSERCVFL